MSSFSSRSYRASQGHEDERCIILLAIRSVVSFVTPSPGPPSGGPPSPKGRGYKKIRLTLPSPFGRGGGGEGLKPMREYISIQLRISGSRAAHNFPFLSRQKRECASNSSRWLSYLEMNYDFNAEDRAHNPEFIGRPVGFSASVRSVQT